MPSRTFAPVERGFSLIELMIALVVTLIVTGSIYGLLGQGQNAFRREPEISDRQQQARVAMDLIQRDIATASMAMPEWTQAFIPGLDGAGPNNAQGVPSDYLEILGYDGACTPIARCDQPGVETSEVLPACYRFPTPMLVLVRPGIAADASIVVATAAGAGACAPGQAVTWSALPAMPPFTWDIPSDDAVPGAPGFGDLRPVQLVLYRIFEDPINGIPNLWRSTQGGLVLPAATGPVDPGNGSDWQLVATGIEDLQVQYRDGDPALDWRDTPQTIDRTLPDPDRWQRIVREVKVTLTARTTGQANLQGESVSVGGVQAIRGQLTSVTAPRASLTALSSGLVDVSQRWN
jgi:prepilin-type N-terminal cleavage/methylation domain-containing protein